MVKLGGGARRALAVALAEAAGKGPLILVTAAGGDGGDGLGRMAQQPGGLVQAAPAAGGGHALAHELMVEPVPVVGGQGGLLGQPVEVEGDSVGAAQGLQHRPEAAFVAVSVIHGASLAPALAPFLRFCGLITDNEALYMYVIEALNTYG